MSVEEIDEAPPETPAAWLYGEARRLDLARLCTCVRLVGDVGWSAREGCKGCRGTGLRCSPYAFPPAAGCVAAWMARGSITPGEYAAVLRHERRLRELETMRRTPEREAYAYPEIFWRLWT